MVVNTSEITTKFKRVVRRAARPVAVALTAAGIIAGVSGITSENNQPVSSQPQTEVPTPTPDLPNSDATVPEGVDEIGTTATAEDICGLGSTRFTIGLSKNDESHRSKAEELAGQGIPAFEISATTTRSGMTDTQQGPAYHLQNPPTQDNPRGGPGMEVFLAVGYSKGSQAECISLNLDNGTYTYKNATSLETEPVFPTRQYTVIIRTKSGSYLYTFDLPEGTEYAPIIIANQPQTPEEPWNVINLGGDFGGITEIEFGAGVQNRDNVKFELKKIQSP